MSEKIPAAFSEICRTVFRIGWQRNGVDGIKILWRGKIGEVARAAYQNGFVDGANSAAKASLTADYDALAKRVEELQASYDHLLEERNDISAAYTRALAVVEAARPYIETGQTGSAAEDALADYDKEKP